MRPSNRYALIWTVSLAIIVVQVWSIVLHANMRARGGGSPVHHEDLFLAALVSIPSAIAVLLWMRLRLGWILSLVLAGLILLYLVYGVVIGILNPTSNLLLVLAPNGALVAAVLALGASPRTRKDYGKNLGQSDWSA